MTFIGRTDIYDRLMSTTGSAGDTQIYSARSGNKSIDQQRAPELNYPVPDNKTQYELIIKKSRFIAITGFASDQNEVRSFIKDAAMKYPDARHVCHASIIGAPGIGSVSCNDDGEPAGTAGKPILNVLQHSGIGDIATVVIRYFGGIKLGAGGLVRAYSNSASGSLTELKTAVAENLLELELIADFALENEIRHWLLNAQASELASSYSNQLKISCKIPAPLIAPAIDHLTNVARGRIKFTKGPPDV